MLFNSIDFAIFLPTVFFLYWFIFNKNVTSQNIFITLVSYLFYGFWDWRFLSLILFSTLTDYLIGLQLKTENQQKKRKALLWLSVLVNIGSLGFFKYYNFFIENFIASFSFFGITIKANTLNIILPVGISFYTFQTLSYTIDVYRKKLKPTKDFFAFSAFVCFFPQLIAGPIERATHLLPQFLNKRTFNYHKATDGLKQILWGLFKKVVIADNCAKYANMIFNDYTEYPGSTLLIGALFFTFQIYGDFSGYSDIAIGTSRLFGFDLKQNFAFPYFSRDIAEFWRRWHISLSTWFRDYIYIPLGGSKGHTWQKIRNTFIIFIISGFWHGANWTFIAWGAINALFFLPLMITKSNRRNIDIVAKGKIIPNKTETLQMLATFSITVLAWVFFRAENIIHAINYFKTLFSISLFSIPQFPERKIALLLTFVIITFLIIEWLGREQKYAIQKFGIQYTKPVRWTFYYLLIIAILYFNGEEQQFIYFQF